MSTELGAMLSTEPKTNKKLQGASWVAVRWVCEIRWSSVIILSHKLRSNQAHRTKYLWQDVGKVVLNCTSSISITKVYTSNS